MGLLRRRSERVLVVRCGEAVLAPRRLDLHGDRMVRRDFAPGGRATLQLKDVRLMSQLAESVGLDSPTLKNSLAQWEKFVHEKGLGDLDHSGLFRLYE